MKTWLYIFLIFSLIACSEEKQQTSLNEDGAPTLNIQQPSQTDSQNENQYQPNYISSEDLHALINGDASHFVFDVRAVAAFEKSHIVTARSMPYGKIDEESLTAVASLARDSQIVTYCGCPRHLSTLVAEQLESMDYKNVSVLYEGYWHWKDNNYPVVENETTAEINKLYFQGTVTNNNQPLKNTDIFLTHEKSGQLEATRTDERGQFDMEFHIFDHAPDDQFSFAVSDLSKLPVKTLTAEAGKTNQLIIAL